MYRLRQLDVDDKVCEQVDLTLLSQVYPPEAIERCVGQSQPWASKVRRGGERRMVALVLFLVGVGLWRRLFPPQGWGKMVGKLSALHPAEPPSGLRASALGGRRKGGGRQ